MFVAFFVIFVIIDALGPPCHLISKLFQHGRRSGKSYHSHDLKVSHVRSPQLWMDVNAGGDHQEELEDVDAAPKITSNAESQHL